MDEPAGKEIYRKGKMMQKFERAIYDTSEREKQELARQIAEQHKVSINLAMDAVNRSQNTEVWMNDKYEVAVYRDQYITHLSIKRLDRAACRDWRDFQEIKNMLVGEENEGVELYPAESRKVDMANQFHLWVLTDPKERFPFGFDEGRWISEGKVGKSKQRKL